MITADDDNAQLRRKFGSATAEERAKRSEAAQKAVMTKHKRALQAEADRKRNNCLPDVRHAINQILQNLTWREGKEIAAVQAVVKMLEGLREVCHELERGGE